LPRLALFLALAALLPVDIGHADSQSFTVSTGHNATALTSGFNRGTELQARVARGSRLYVGSIDSRGLASLGLGWIASSQDPDFHNSRYPVITVFGRSGERSGIAFDLHHDWFWRVAPSRTPGKHVTMFQTQGGVVCRGGLAPKVRVTHRLVSTSRRRPARSQGVEWVWEFHPDYPATYSRTQGRGEMTALQRQSMRMENWVFFTRELGFGVIRVNIGATHKTVTQDVSTDEPPKTPIEEYIRSSGPTTSRVPVLLFRLGYEIRRW